MRWQLPSVRLTCVVVVCEVIFMILGFGLGQIRTLQTLSWLSNLAIWLNVICILMTCVVQQRTAIYLS